MADEERVEPTLDPMLPPRWLRPHQQANKNLLKIRLSQKVRPTYSS